MLLALVLLACPPLDKPVSEKSLVGAKDVTKSICGKTAGTRPEGGSGSWVVVREKGAVREITFTDAHEWAGLGDASGHDTEQVTFLQVDGGTVWVDSHVSHGTETGPGRYEKVTCRLDETGKRCRTADKGVDSNGWPADEKVGCGPEAEARLPTLAGVQKRLKLCPALVPPAPAP